jgi:hypothetical protein
VINNMAIAQRVSFEDKLKKEEEELEALKKEHTGATEESSEETEEESLSAEEKSFKKRYGDIRTLQQTQKKEFEDKLAEMQRQLDAATKKEMKLPTSEEEIEAWATKYPQVAKIVESIAMKKAKEQSAQYEDRFAEIENMKVDALRQKAEAQLIKAHPDWEDIREDDAFHAWADEQPKAVQDALYENETDGKLAAWAVGLYKQEMGISKAKKASPKDAAKAVGTKSERSSPDASNSKGVIYESQVAKMSAHEYEKNADAIAEAIQSGKFVYDMSAGAR